MASGWSIGRGVGNFRRVKHPWFLVLPRMPRWTPLGRIPLGSNRLREVTLNNGAFDDGASGAFATGELGFVCDLVLGAWNFGGNGSHFAFDPRAGGVQVLAIRRNPR